MARKKSPMIEAIAGASSSGPIDTLYIFVAVAEDGSESITAVRIADYGWMPMVTTRESNVALMRESAQKIATAGGQTVKLVKLTTRTVIETFNPETGDSHAETR